MLQFSSDLAIITETSLSSKLAIYKYTSTQQPTSLKQSRQQKYKNVRATFFSPFLFSVPTFSKKKYKLEAREEQEIRNDWIYFNKN